VLHYLHLDVFTDRRFTGNQLAVYLDPPPALPERLMQAIAREMNFSETTFVFAPEQPDTDCRVRIFTPGAELPMAGHPTIGTAFALAEEGRLTPAQPRTVFGEGVGPVPVDLEWGAGGLRFAWMTQHAPVVGFEIQNLATLSGGLGIDPDDLRPDGWPVQQVSCGVPFLIVPVASRAAVDRAVPDARTLARTFVEAGAEPCGVFLFTREPGADGADVYTRMFAPELGIVEDPATGSAAGPLGAYLVQRGAAEGGRVIRNLQGVVMGRPSWIHISAVVQQGVTTAMRVGGTAVLVGRGSVDLS
jgi:trans-2,3-dihydro-3-hydroxyanthranilate isomerase